MARKVPDYDDLDEMRKDLDKLGEALRIPVPPNRASGKATRRPGDQTISGSARSRARVAKKAARSRKGGHHA